MNQITRYEYTTLGALKSTNQSDSIQTMVTSKEYDERGNLVKKSESATPSETYAVDSKGQVVKKTDPKGGTFNYTYDSLGRLTQGGNSSVSQKYTYGGNPFGAAKIEDYAGSNLLSTLQLEYSPKGYVKNKTVTQDGYSNRVENTFDGTGGVCG